MPRPMLVFIASAALWACALPKPGPIHFPSGESRWSAPLVGALDSDLLVVPVRIGEGGKTYLFVLSPDSEASLVDAETAKEADLFTGVGDERRFESKGGTVKRRQFHVPKIQIGTLVVRSFRAYETPARSLEVNGRRVHGVLGRNVFRQTVSIFVDRDKGRVELALMTDDAHLMRGRPIQGRSWQNYDARHAVVVPISVDGKAREMAVNLGAKHSAVRSELLPKSATRVHAVDFDSQGRHQVKPLVSAELRLADDFRNQVRLIAYQGSHDYNFSYDGLLGQDFLRNFRYLYRRESRELWLAPRDHGFAKSAGERLTRFTEFARCAKAACTELYVDGRTTRVHASAKGPKSWIVYLQHSVRAPGAGERLRRLVVHAGQEYELRGEWHLVDADPFAPERATPLMANPLASRRVD